MRNKGSFAKRFWHIRVTIIFILLVYRPNFHYGSKYALEYTRIVFGTRDVSILPFLISHVRLVETEDSLRISKIVAVEAAHKVKGYLKSTT